MSIVIISELEPYNNGDFALMDDKYLKGGYRVVADTTERDAITAGRKKIGMVVRVVADNLEYQWNGSAWVAPGYAGENTITTLGTVTTGTWNATAIAVAYGGTGASTAAGARTNLGLGTLATQNFNNVSITGGSVSGISAFSCSDSFYFGSATDGPSATKEMTIQSNGYAGIALYADSDNDGSELGSPYVYMSQDGGSATAVMGMVQSNGGEPRGGSYTGTLNNAIVIGGYTTFSPLQFGTNGIVRMTILANGGIGIAGATPDTNQIFQLPNSASQQAKANAWNTYSDARLKTNVSQIQGALDKIMNMNGYYYNWKESAVTPDNKELTPEDIERIQKDISIRCAGGMAQEWAEYVPEICTYDEEGIATSIDYGKLTPFLIEAVKDIANRVSTLEGAK